MTVTKKRVLIMILIVWACPILISFLPIFAEWYTTSEHLKYRAEHPEECPFVVNQLYGLISSSISFWIPSVIMLMTYGKVSNKTSCDMFPSPCSSTAVKGAHLLTTRHNEGFKSALLHSWFLFRYCSP
jgi:hypothetical protein